jgi:Ni,Fe-hydrogenase III small subunit
MIRWFLHGVSRRRLTIRYPRSPEPAPPGFRARATVSPGAVVGERARELAALCLPGALAVDGRGELTLDDARCIGCGLCAGELAMDAGYELARRGAHRGRRLPAPFRRSLHIRHLDAGSDGAVEQEIAALLNPYYDMQRLGLFFTASPRHADVLLVTGPVTAPLEAPLRRTYEAMPEPRVVVAAGTDACSGSIWTAPEVRGGVDRVLPVDVYIPGDPPSPIALLHGLLLAAGRAREAPSARRHGGALGAAASEREAGP